jgi:hypothetical protein
MPKIANLFDQHGNINPECTWVLRGAHATKMYDGVGYLLEPGVTSCLGDMREAGFGGYIFDALKYHEVEENGLHRPWSYELVGPGIKGNHEHQHRHILIPHGRFIYKPLTEREFSYTDIKQFLAGRNTEGIVFWEDVWDYTCRKAKVTQADFGMKRNMKGDLE